MCARLGNTIWWGLNVLLDADTGLKCFNSNTRTITENHHSVSELLFPDVVGVWDETGSGPLHLPQLSQRYCRPAAAPVISEQRWQSVWQPLRGPAGCRQLLLMLLAAGVSVTQAGPCAAHCRPWTEIKTKNRSEILLGTCTTLEILSPAALLRSAF